MLAGLGQQALANTGLQRLFEQAGVDAAAALGDTDCAVLELLPDGETYRQTAGAPAGAPSDQDLSVIIGSPERPFGRLSARPIGARQYSPEDAVFLQSAANLLANAIRRHQAESQIQFQSELLAAVGSPIIVTDLEGVSNTGTPRLRTCTA